jgi:hypothetical protein
VAGVGHDDQLGTRDQIRQAHGLVRG